MYVAAGHQQPVVDDAAIAKIQSELAQSRKHADSFLNLLKELPPAHFAQKDVLETLQQVYSTTKEMRDRTALLVQQLYDNQSVTSELLFI